MKKKKPYGTKLALTDAAGAAAAAAAAAAAFL